ncbi:MAG: TerB family tellurite resistance protein [Betaproteobacteria bacterium]
MPTVSSPAAILEKLKMPAAALDSAAAVNIELSPPLVLAAALLYMMLSNGEVEKAEIDQLQSVIGKNADLLRCAVDYVQSVPVEQFIADAPQVLEAPDRLCVLTNMCDAMLSDGHADAVELDLLARLTEAFGLSDDEFQPFYEAITLKNDKTVLGMFDAAKLATQQATPHLAMAASLIYMMASDGSLGPEEIGRLTAMIGEFEGLQKVAVKYALKVKSEQFFASASRFLNDDQKIFILTNVCDIMLADGVIEDAEKVVFQNMRNSFGFSEEEFAPFHVAVTAKNIKTFDTTTFTYARDSRLADDSDPDDIFSNPSASFNPSASGSSVGSSRAKFGSTVSRAMRANIVKVSNDFGSTKKLGRISDNSHVHGQEPPETSTVTLKPRPEDRFEGTSFDTAPAQANTRRPIGSGGRNQSLDPNRPRALPRASDAPRTAEVDSSPMARRPAPVLAAAGTRPAPAHRARRPVAAAQTQAQSAQAAAALEQARDRLKNSHASNADIRQQLDHYDATGKMVRSPAGAKALSTRATSPAQASPIPQATATLQTPASAPSTREIAHKLRAAAAASLRRRRDALASRLGQAADSLLAAASSENQQQKGAAPSAGASRPSIRAAAAIPAWRVAVPIAILSSALMAGTATVMASLAPQPTGGWIEAPTNTASVGPCLVGHALSKQSWFPRAAAGCWSVPQPQSVSASLGRTVRQLARVRFL